MCVWVTDVGLDQWRVTFVLTIFLTVLVYGHNNRGAAPAASGRNQRAAAETDAFRSSWYWPSESSVRQRQYT